MTARALKLCVNKTRIARVLIRSSVQAARTHPDGSVSGMLSLRQVCTNGFNGTNVCFGLLVTCCSSRKQFALSTRVAVEVKDDDVGGDGRRAPPYNVDETCDGGAPRRGVNDGCRPRIGLGRVNASGRRYG